jgi:hypothetical protein
MTDSSEQATGVWAAILVDVLFGLGVEDPRVLTHEQRWAVILEATKDGRISPDRAKLLRNRGFLPTDSN